MNDWQRADTARADAAARTRRITQAVADREQGRRRLNAATVGVAVGSVALAGVVVAVLPGSSHAATVKGSAPATSGTTQGSTSGTTQGSGSGSSSSSDSTNSSGDQGSLQQPASPPQAVLGGGGANATSGGS